METSHFFSLHRGEAAVQEYRPPSHKIMAHSSMYQPRFEHQFAKSTSSSTDDVQDPEVSDSESGIVGCNYQENTGLMRIDEGDKVYGVISKKFLSGLGCFGSSTQITAIHKETCSSFTKQAKLQSFLIFLKLCGSAEKC
ncbi:hypothetical protein HAX54_034190 [Datura stramonium]|uniref:Uncharacterized protein n=1 Tax=Datura stramonium TaxID=4076 RepID=A0ABS8VDJ0_DATST|nr:hypothetical protein [Datura stramonium]